MPARSLLAMSTRVAIQHVRSLTDIGNIPYSLARPFLVKIELPAQLREIERNSPHIMEEDRELWLEFIKRDIPQWDQYDLPETSDCWYDIYTNLVEKVQRELEEDALRLKRAVDKINMEKANNSAVLVKDARLLPQPRRRGQPRSEPKKTGIFQSKRNKALAVPTHQLNNGASQIKHVPQWLVDEHKQPPIVAQKRSVPTGTPKNTMTSVSNSRTPESIVLPGCSQGPRVIRSAPRPAVSPTKPQPDPGTRSSLTAKRPTEVQSPVNLRASSNTSSSNSPKLAPSTPVPLRKRPPSSPPNVFLPSKKKKI